MSSLRTVCEAVYLSICLHSWYLPVILYLVHWTFPHKISRSLICTLLVPFAPQVLYLLCGDWGEYLIVLFHILLLILPSYSHCLLVPHPIQYCITNVFLLILISCQPLKTIHTCMPYPTLRIYLPLGSQITQKLSDSTFGSTDNNNIMNFYELIITELHSALQEIWILLNSTIVTQCIW